MSGTGEGLRFSGLNLHLGHLLRRFVSRFVAGRMLGAATPGFLLGVGAGLVSSMAMVIVPAPPPSRAAFRSRHQRHGPLVSLRGGAEAWPAGRAAPREHCR